MQLALILHVHFTTGTGDKAIWSAYSVLAPNPQRIMANPHRALTTLSEGPSML